MGSFRRFFSGKAIELLITAKTMLQSAFNHQAELIAEQTILPTVANLQALKTRIEAAYQIVGGDKGGAQRDATIVVNKMSANAKVIIAKMKSHIKIIYRRNPAERENILTALGFTRYLKGVQSKDQEAIVSLLLKFNENLTPAREAAFLAGGVPAVQIAEIRGYATTLIEADIDQEILKGTSKELTESDINTLNEIYTDLMDIAAIGKNAFKKRPSVYDQFVYSKVLARINGNHGNNDDTGPVSPSTDA